MVARWWRRLLSRVDVWYWHSRECSMECQRPSNFLMPGENLISSVTSLQKSCFGDPGHIQRKHVCSSLVFSPVRNSRYVWDVGLNNYVMSQNTQWISWIQYHYGNNNTEGIIPLILRPLSNKLSHVIKLKSFIYLFHIWFLILILTLNRLEKWEQLLIIKVFLLTVNPFQSILLTIV